MARRPKPIDQPAPRRKACVNCGALLNPSYLDKRGRCESCVGQLALPIATT